MNSDACHNKVDRVLGQKAKIIYEPPEEATLLADRMLFSDVGDVSLGAPYPSAITFSFAKRSYLECISLPVNSLYFHALFTKIQPNLPTPQKSAKRERAASGGGSSS